MDNQNNNDVPELKQALNNEAEFTGVYSIWLLFKEKGQMPQTKDICEKLEERFGKVDIVSELSGLNAFALLEHTVTYEDNKKAPSQLLITEFIEKNEAPADEIARTQFWDCPGGADLMDSCGWQVMISDFMAAGLPYMERAEILADWAEIALELFWDCEAVYFQPSGKLLTAGQIRNNHYKDAVRFIYGGVNARFFNIEGTNDMLVDTLGLYALGLPDVQYHFHGVDPNKIVNHAYNVAIYQFQNDIPIQSGDSIDSIYPPQQWDCEYESSLIQPVREVLDVNMGKKASGKRQ